MTRLDQLKIRLGIIDDTKDDLLNLLLQDAENDFLSYTKQKEVPTQAEGLIVKMALFYYNNQNQAAKSEKIGDYTVEYQTDLPGDLRKDLNHFRKVELI